jgi:photosystem II stability/assembly factor-like uncharacterized protein
MSSWKSYGGIDKFDKTTNISVNSIVANYFTIKKQIAGDLDISGNIAVGQDFAVTGNSAFNGSISVGGGVKVAANIDVSNNIRCDGDVYFNNSLNLQDYLLFGSDTNKNYLFGDASGIGINNYDPQAALDISGSQFASIRVFSSQTTNRNVLSQNMNKHGIVLWSDNSNATIDFFVDSVISDVSANFDGRIQYQSGGDILIDSNKVVKIVPQMVVSGNTADTSIKNSTITIHNDNSDNVFKYDVYQQSSSYVNNAMSMVSMDNSSVIFMNMINPDFKGFAIGGGQCPYDNTRSIGAMGCIDISNGTFNPSQTVVAGNSVVRYKTTTGINTYKPRQDKYVLDINGPVHITNGENTVIAKPKFEIYSMNFLKSGPKIGMAVGAPNDISGGSYSLQSYITKDGGHSWRTSTIRPFKPGTTNSMRVVAMYDPTFALTFGRGLEGYYTTDGGNIWNSKNYSGLSQTPVSVYISSDKILIGTVEKQLFYIDASSSTIGNVSYSVDNSMNVNGAYIDGYGDYVFVAGNGIQKYLLSNLSTDGSAHGTDFSYNAVQVFDASYVVAAGNGVLSYTVDGGTSWTDASTAYVGVNFKSISILDPSNVIVVGDNGKMIYTTDGINWDYLQGDIINSSGGEDMLDGSLNNVYVLDKDAFLVSRVITSSNTGSSITGESNIVFNYFPNVLNHANNTVMDVCGNMKIYGNILMDNQNGSDIGMISTTGNTFYLLNNDTNTIYFGGDASNIYIGESGKGMTKFMHGVDVSGDITISGFLTAAGTSFNATAVAALYINMSSDNVNTAYVLDINGNSRSQGPFVITSMEGLSADSSGAFYVAGGSHFDGNVAIHNTNTASVDSSGAFYVAGGGYFGGNLIATSNDATGALQVYGGSSFDGSMNISTGQVMIQSAIHCTSDNAHNGALYVSDGGAKINGNVYVAEQLVIGGTENAILVPSGNVLLAKNLTVSGITYSTLTQNSSDYRIKEKVVDLSDQYTVDPLRPVFYHHTTLEKDQIGFLAHELQEHFPFLVEGEKDGEKLQSINYMGLIGVLVREIQDLKKRVKDLEDA